MKSSAYFGEFHDLQKNRKRMIQDLSLYRKIRRHEIKLVFDAHLSGEIKAHTDQVGGVDVVFTKFKELADQRIIELSRQYKEQAIVVTNDREIIHFIELCGATAIPSEVFEERVQLTLRKSNEQPQVTQWRKPSEDEFKKDDTEAYSSKKGNPRRLPKKIKKYQSILEKL